MSTDNLTKILTTTTKRLSKSESLKELFHQHRDGNQLPSGKTLKEIMVLSRSILFPGHCWKSTLSIRTITYHIGINIERLHKLLSDRIATGLCFVAQKT